MLSKVQKLIDCAEKMSVLACPVCHESLMNDGSCFRCRNNHTFNLNRKGFVNFLSSPAESCYDEELFLARSKVFDCGIYQPVLQEIHRILGKRRRILDAGCGEGWYLSKLLELDSSRLGCGIDISRDAVVKAARHEISALWCVADLMHLPFLDRSFDAVLDILTPANYAEFARVLGKKGVLVKVYPGKNYLREIREKRSMPLYEEGSVDKYLSSHAKINEKHHIVVTSRIDEEIWRNLVWMTPLNQDLTPSEKNAVAENPSSSITIDLYVAECSFS